MRRLPWFLLLVAACSAQSAESTTRPSRRISQRGRPSLFTMSRSSSRFPPRATRLRSSEDTDCATCHTVASSRLWGEKTFAIREDADRFAAPGFDLTATIADTWSQVDMGIGRRNASTVLLPDGNVLVMGGWNEDGNLPGDRRQPQVLDPRTKQVTTYAAWPDDPFERGYHSFAVLLKDGSVLIGGGISPKIAGVEVSSIGCERNDVRIYEPGYLTKDRAP